MLHLYFPGWCVTFTWLLNECSIENGFPQSTQLCAVSQIFLTMWLLNSRWIFRFTKRTPKWLNSRVFKHVSIEPRLFPEPFPTNLTFMRLLSSMYSCVQITLSRTYEFIATQFTCKPLLLNMSKKMIPRIFASNAHFSTKPTGLMYIITVNAFNVIPKSSFSRKSSFILIAFQVFFAGSKWKWMVVQIWLCKKLLSTQVTFMWP